MYLNVHTVCELFQTVNDSVKIHTVQYIQNSVKLNTMRQCELTMTLFKSDTMVC